MKSSHALSSYTQDTYSYAQMMFVLGDPMTNAPFDPVQNSAKSAVTWSCGCQSTGRIHSSMVWIPCELHAYYKYCSSSHLNEETLLSGSSAD